MNDEQIRKLLIQLEDPQHYRQAYQRLRNWILADDDSESLLRKEMVRLRNSLIFLSPSGIISNDIQLEIFINANAYQKKNSHHLFFLPNSLLGGLSLEWRQYPELEGAVLLFSDRFGLSGTIGWLQDVFKFIATLYKNLIIDFTNVRYFNSKVFRIFLTPLENLERIALVNAPDLPIDKPEKTGISYHDTLEEAIADFLETEEDKEEIAEEEIIFDGIMMDLDAAVSEEADLFVGGLAGEESLDQWDGFADEVPKKKDIAEHEQEIDLGTGAIALPPVEPEPTPEPKTKKIVMEDKDKKTADDDSQAFARQEKPEEAQLAQTQIPIEMGKQDLLQEVSDIKSFDQETIPVSETVSVEDETSIEDLMTRAPAQYKEVVAKKAKSGLGGLFRLIFLPFIAIGVMIKILGSLVTAVVEKITDLVTKLIDNIKEKAQKAGVPTFEILLSEDAGTPGPIERITAQSKLLMRTIQVTIGLKFILLANAIDNILEIFIGYIYSIYNTWKLMKTAKRRIEREFAGGPLEDMAKDLELCRYYLARLLRFPGFTIEEIYSLDENQQQKIIQATFALEITLQARGHIDEMKRDLDLVTIAQAGEFAKKSAIDFIMSFIPNPLGIFIPWKDMIIFLFFMKYNRHDIEQMYKNYVESHFRTLDFLQSQYYRKDCRQICDYARVMPWEQYCTDNKKYWLSLENITENLPSFNFSHETIESLLDQNRHAGQRLLYALSNPARIIYPHYWSNIELLQEMFKTKNILATLEFEHRLIPILTKISPKMSSRELALLTKDFARQHKRRKVARKIEKQFLAV